MNALTFNPEKHEYRYDGRIVPGVTQLLKWAGLIDDSWFSDWHGERGRLIHLACQYYDEGSLDMDSVHPEIAGYLESYIKWREAGEHIIIMSIEERVFNEAYWYAGTLDRRVGIDFIPSIIDIKSGAYQRWHGLQLAGYQYAKPFQTNLFCDRYSLYLDGSGAMAKLRKHEDSSDIDVFLSIAQAYNNVLRWKK